MRIRMTDDDIIQGECKNPYNCPVARAVAREMEMCDGDGLPDHVYVGQSFVEVGCDPAVEYYLPEKVVKFIKAFDKGEELDPIEFELPDDII